MHFGCYNLHEVSRNPGLLNRLGGGVLDEIDKAFGPVLPRAPKPQTESDPAQGELLAPTSQALSDLMGVVAPNKTLQDNTAFALHRLGTDAYRICADWLRRSGAMHPIRGGAFIDPTIAAPGQVDTLVCTGNVANWTERKLDLVKRIDPDDVGQVILPVGNRVMGAGEHQQVRTYARQNKGRYPTETQYVEEFVLDVIQRAGFGTIKLLPVESNNGDAVAARLFEVSPELLERDHQTLVVAASPSAIQSAGQIRLAGRRVDSAYDYNGTQLFVRSDRFPIGEPGDPAEEAQNPISGVGQILRNFKFLLDNAAPPKAAA